MVERDLAKVEVAGSSPVFRSLKFHQLPADGIFCFKKNYIRDSTRVVELVDTQDLKSCSPKKRVRVQFPSRVQNINSPFGTEVLNGLLI